MKNKAHILFLYRGNTQKRIFDKTDEQGPFDFLYGFENIKNEKSYIITPRGQRKKLIQKFCYLFEKPIAMTAKLGFPLEIYPMFFNAIKKASVLFAINDTVSFGTLFYKRVKLLDAKVVVIIQSLPERLKLFKKNKLLIWFFKNLLESADYILTFSKHAQIPLHETFKVPKEKLKVFYFGVDTAYWTQNSNNARSSFILSVGNDINRDFNTLAQALPTELALKIVTQQNVNTKNKNIELIQNNITDSELRTLYQTAQLAVIPSIALEYESSGLSSILQCMSCGLPVIASYAPTLAELFEDEKEILFYEPENPKSLSIEIQRLVNDPQLQKTLSKNAKKLVNEKYTTHAMASQIDMIIDSFGG